MIYYNEKYTVPLCKLGICNTSPNREKWIDEIVDFIYEINQNQHISKSNIEYNTFYDLGDNYSVHLVLEELQKEIQSGIITDLDYFSINSQIFSNINHLYHALEKYCISLWKQENNTKSKQQIKFEIMDSLII